MGLSAAEELGKLIANNINDTQAIKNDVLPDETDQSLNLVPKERMRVTLAQSTIIRYYPTDSFILDHPVYGELDSSTLIGNLP